MLVVVVVAVPVVVVAMVVLLVAKLMAGPTADDGSAAGAGCGRTRAAAEVATGGLAPVRGFGGRLNITTFSSHGAWSGGNRTLILCDISFPLKEEPLKVGLGNSSEIALWASSAAAPPHQGIERAAIGGPEEGVPGLNTLDPVDALGPAGSDDSRSFEEGTRSAAAPGIFLPLPCFRAI